VLPIATARPPTDSEVRREEIHLPDAKPALGNKFNVRAATWRAIAVELARAIVEEPA
jgi:hypothetical protein